MRFAVTCTAFLAVFTLAACDDRQSPATSPTAPIGIRASQLGASGVMVTNVTDDTTAQNETPLAVNPLNSQNLLTGNNDWNYNDGCGVNASFNGGKSWTKTLPNGFIPGITKYTNDPAVDGTGLYDYAGDPAVAFGPDGTAYFACFGYQASPPYNVVLFLSRSTDGGKTWLSGDSDHRLTQVTVFQGNGVSKGSTGQFADHEAMTVAPDGTIYVTWAQFHGYGSNSPVWVATSTDGGRTFSSAMKVTSGTTRSDQDQRIAIAPDGTAYLTFDNSVQGGKGTAMFVSKSTDQGRTWTTPIQFGTFKNPVCLFPPYCFNISGGQFRGPGSYPAPAYNQANDRLYVAYADIVGGRAKIFITSAKTSDLGKWSDPAVVADGGSGDRFAAELSTAPNGRLDVAFYDRSYTGNALVDMTYASSTDGVTWSTVRITKSGFDPSQYGVPSGSGIRPFIGDYNGIISLPGSAGMTWTGPGKTYGSLPTNLEIYFASVTL
ncbi:MAG TPA: sialidase family protein [Gemmatimonadaceae bacterium]